MKSLKFYNSFDLIKRNQMRASERGGEDMKPKGIIKTPQSIERGVETNIRENAS